MIIKALTVYEPWASLIAINKKKIETRSWCTKYRGPLAIHAAKKIPGDIVFQEPLYSALIPLHNGDGIMFPGHCILAICNLVDCVKITPEFVVGLSTEGRVFGDYTPGRYAWVLEDVHRLKEPIPAKGRQRIWNWDETEHLVSIDPWVVGNTRIWTPQGVLSGKRLTKANDDAIAGLEVA